MMNTPSPVTISTGVSTGPIAGLAVEAEAGQGFARLLGVDELPPEAVALLLAAMGGASMAAAATAGVTVTSTATATTAPRAMATCAPPPAVHSARMTDRPGDASAILTAQAPAPLPVRAGDAESATGSDNESHPSLEAVLRDLLASDETVERGTTNGQSTKEPLLQGPLHAAVSANRPVHEPLSRPAPPIHTPVGAPGWSDELAGCIAWIARDDLHSATIRLSPEHLGPLDVQISVRDGDAVVSFGASHAETRAALEQALPRLRELLASQGIALAHANVSEHAARHERPPALRHLAVPGDEAEPAQDGALRAPLGLIDLYA